MKFNKLGSLHTPSGTKPINLLCEISNASTLSRPGRLFGRVPMNELELASNTVAWPSSPISSGKHPPSALFRKMISFKFVMLPMLRGMQPEKLLLASVTAEAVDLPIVSGIMDANRLLFKNIASRSLTKSSKGSSPSKSLYLRSRYLRADQVSTTFGKGPTKRLLLTSNSCMS